MILDILFPSEDVGLNGVWRHVEGIQDLYPQIRVVHWADTSGTVEFTDPTEEMTTIVSVSDYLQVKDMWDALTPLPHEETDDELRERTVAEYMALFCRFMDETARGNGIFFSLQDAMCYASTPNALQIASISLVEWSALVRVSAEATFTDIINSVIEIMPYEDFQDALPIYTAPGEE